MSPIRVMLADDHPVVRTGIRNLIEKAVDIEVVGEASTAGETLKMVMEFQPDILLLDMELPDAKGTDVAMQLQQSNSKVKILALSAYDDPVYIRELLELGASGYLMKEEAPDTILDAIRGVAHGEQGWVSRQIAAQMVSWVRGDENDGSKLTSREFDVLRLVVEGRTNQNIAANLGISEKTVEKYMDAIFTKLGVASRVEAAVYAVREGLV
ncbi:MAG: response regulator transcription factor [Chloroflexi bacterium]|nr:response regulator transcription factor [Anaerolineaceae bacterium]NMB88537.1 response regulator transcription factor [Chloroflexota bacterium]